MRRASWALRPRAALLALCLAMSLLCAPSFAEEAPEVDFAGQTPLIRYADTVQLEVTVHTFVGKAAKLTNVGKLVVGAEADVTLPWGERETAQPGFHHYCHPLER